MSYVAHCCDKMSERKDVAAGPGGSWSHWVFTVGKQKVVNPVSLCNPRPQAIVKVLSVCKVVPPISCNLI